MEVVQRLQKAIEGRQCVAGIDCLQQGPKRRLLDYEDEAQESTETLDVRDDKSTRHPPRKAAGI